jgi:hypothetical protein
MIFLLNATEVARIAALRPAADSRSHVGGSNVMNYRTLIAVMSALSLAALSSAEAGSKHKRHNVERHGVAAAFVPAAPIGVRASGPPWALPWECFTDEGYGRYRPCNVGRR